MSAHSSIVGGSTCARVLACPGSVVAILGLPPSIAVSSEYAEEGTFYHAVMAALMEAREANNDEDLEALAVKWIGQRFHDRQLEQHHIDEGITPALAALDRLEQDYNGGFTVVAVEYKVKFPDLFDVFGTVDLILSNGTTILHVDFKFGQGVPVAAKYGDTVNPQLMFYMTAARRSIGYIYKSNTLMAAAIIQPRIEDKLSHTMVTTRELHAFRHDLVGAVRSALSPQAPRAKGEHCRWAPCKATCPLWTGPLLEAAAFNMIAAPPAPAELYAVHLAHAKRLVDMVSVLKSEVDLQLHRYLANGGKVPGWRLKFKQRNRAWIDEETVDKDLRKLGMKPAEIWRKKLLTFEAADAWAKRKHKKIPDHLRVAPQSTETVIAQDSDPAPLAEPRQVVIEQFQASLRQLLGPSVEGVTGNRS